MSNKSWDDDDETDLLNCSMREAVPPTVTVYGGLSTYGTKVKLSVPNGSSNYIRKTGIASKTNPTHNLHNQNNYNTRNVPNQLQLTSKSEVNIKLLFLSERFISISLILIAIYFKYF